MNFEGTYQIKAPQEKVWNFVIDPNRIGKCLPDLKSLETVGEDQFGAVVRVGIGFIKGDFGFRLAIVDKEAPKRARLKGAGSGSGSSIDLDTIIELTEMPDGTKLTYKADVNVGGLLAGLGQRMMSAAAEKIVGEVFECIRTELEK